MSSKIEPSDIVQVDTYVFRAPIDNPVKTSFGVMHDRPALLLRVEDRDGAYGWGEVWCNFPVCGAEYRARLLDMVLVPLLLQAGPCRPPEVFDHLTRKLHILGLQTGDIGPVAHSIAGVDIALWDLAARKAGQPLHRLLGGETVDAVPAYASGINPDGAAETVAKARSEGYRAFKLKVGFNREADRANVQSLLAGLRPGEALMLDANQAWDLEAAEEFLREMDDSPIQWLEEPLPVDRPPEEWGRLAGASPIPLAGGENLRSSPEFASAIKARHLGVIQPDACKWGGVTGCLEVARWALRAGLRYCPHYLGGGIGLLASAHLLAAAGGDGLLEVDFNPNPLREALAEPYPALDQGRFPLPVGPGLGVEPDLKANKSFVKMHTGKHNGKDLDWRCFW
ncbi:MAG: mandelate racemase/muconate lactonizing enzyme family protein [Desulfarculaceae bacterium]|nr:mandelate racemase/muconate lactonizing enzyme family protein [Desulfarculaceae bacterium]MCF8046752.1 mandelate racemase/muconate lactonizing enzyme family protein [Desulfarculaceae bacterium]MCF8099296.1 mandelate racemase/muconate lactonizing enzyme family protein [Desulfarculaceae bacterium]MCF8124530.1 mandelate racemase/muconate lactonizing enzyme family protein [Desulfarculaceae bacterium]